MSSRSRRRSNPTSRWVYAVLGLIVLALIFILLLPTLVMTWTRGYLQNEAFRSHLQKTFGTQLQGQVHLAPLKWTGDEMTTAEITMHTADGWTTQLDGIHLTLDWNAFRQGTWRMVGTGVDQISLQKAPPPSFTPAALSENGPTPLPSMAEGSPIPRWLRSYLPSTVHLDGVRVERFSFLHPGPWNFREGKLRISPWQQGEPSIQVNIEGGLVETPLELSAQLLPIRLNLQRASLRLSRDDVHLKEARMTWLDQGEVTAQGHLEPEKMSWEVTTQVSNIPLRECLDEDWKLRLSGALSGDLRASSSGASAPSIVGTASLKDGVLTALPVLDQLAAYTQVERFKRLVLDIASAEVKMSGSRRTFEQIVVQSNGLLRLEGRLSIEGDQIDGTFLLGLTPETLKWLPGASQDVFTLNNPHGPAGMAWTPLRITGSLQAPREDLSSRLASAAGKALLKAPGDIASQGSQLLLSPVIGKEAGSIPGQAIQKATETGSQAVETGVKMLEGISGGLFGR